MGSIFTPVQDFIRSARSFARSITAKSPRGFNLTNLERTVKTGQQCWDNDLSSLESKLSQCGDIVDISDIARDVVGTVHLSSHQDGDFGPQAALIQTRFEWSSRPMVLVQLKTATQLRKKVPHWEKSLLELLKMFVDGPPVNSRVGPWDLMTRAWGVYMAACSEINRRPFYNGIQLFLLTFVSCTLLKTYLVIPVIVLGFTVSWSEHAYTSPPDNNEAQRMRVVKLLRDALDDVPSLLNRASDIKNKVNLKLKDSHIYPAPVLRFVKEACDILRTPTVEKRKEMFDDMVPRWIEALGKSDGLEHGRPDAEADKLMGDIADLLIWYVGSDSDAGRRSSFRET
ncbi:hypothetical protein QBC41DRAFT_275616 [Cercophora samala]|uniref:Uncharacterized protein n=1 Tax=Cercophora samala TaxID=330535 RepID=A0AA39ZDI7_9PEZI|nr:hypothetical protein QBC41DRAFT_275616 [Cercophora samala]